MPSQTSAKPARRLSSIRTQLALGSAVILVLASAIAVTGYMSLHRLQASIQDTLEEANGIREQSFKIESEFLLARQHESRFMVSWRALGFQPAAGKYITAHRIHLNQAKNYLEKLQSLVQTANHPDLQSLTGAIGELGPVLDTYEQGFAAAVADIEKRSRTGGLENELRDQLSHLKLAVEMLSKPKVRELLLQLSANEQSYLGTGRREYVDKVRLVSNELIALVGRDDLARFTATGSGFTAPELISHIERHLQQFTELVALDQDTEIKTTIFLEVATDIDRLISRISEHSETGVALARTQLRNISKQSTFILSLTAVLSLTLGIVVATRLAQQIIRPLRQLSQAAEQMGQGDLQQAVAVKGSYELVTLAQAFNAMAAQLTRIFHTVS